MTTQTQQHKCYQAALNMLVRREHSRLELTKKLQQKEFSDEDITHSISLLIEQKYQSDERFSESFIHMRFGQGKGPILIAVELKDRGIKDFDLSTYDWFDLAKEVRKKKVRYEYSSRLQGESKAETFLAVERF